MMTDRALVSEHRVKLESVVNGREYTSYQCTCLRCFRNAVACHQAVPKATILHVKMLLGFPLGSLSLYSYPRVVPNSSPACISLSPTQANLNLKSTLRDQVSVTSWGVCMF